MHSRSFRGRRLLIRSFLLLLAAMLWFVASASAKTWKVTTTADPSSGSCAVKSCSLRQAVAAAASGDTILLPASKAPYALKQGQLVIESSLTIKGAGAKSTVIKAEDSGRVMLVYRSFGPVLLEDLTVTGGNTATTGKSGGGIAVGGPGSLVLNHVDVTGNHVDTTAMPDIFNQGGGGIFSDADVYLYHSAVTGNTVKVPASDGDGGGGGILMAQTTDNSDSLTIVDSTVSRNTATVAPDGASMTDANGGGGIYMDGSNLSITGSWIDDNSADVSSATPNTSTPTDGGGGIFQFGNDFLLQDSTVSGNVATGPGVSRGGGGGILDTGNTSRYIDSTIYGNTSKAPAASDDSDGGGGVLLNNVKNGVTMASMTIDGNSAGSAAGGGINVIGDNPSYVQIADSIVAENSAKLDGNCSGKMVSFGHNLTNNPASSHTCRFGPDGDVVAVKPMLGKLAENGGPTPTQALLPGSAAISKGDPDGCTDLFGGLLTTDQRGVSRPAPGHGRCDIGAYQARSSKRTEKKHSLHRPPAGFSVSEWAILGSNQ